MINKYRYVNSHEKYKYRGKGKLIGWKGKVFVREEEEEEEERHVMEE